MLPFWNGDKLQCSHLSRLLADLEPTHNDTADVLFCSRFDCAHDLTAEEYLSRKFNIFSYTSKRRGTGWPIGCNELLLGMLEWFYHKKESGKIPNYRALFVAESDCIPLQRDWIARLTAEWDKIPQPKVMAGAWLSNGVRPGLGHINGGCCFLSGDPKFLKWMLRQSLPRAGWDYALAPAMKQWGWANIPMIRSEWRTPITEETFKTEQEAGTIFYHGCKGLAGIDLARKNLL